MVFLDQYCRKSDGAAIEFSDENLPALNLD